MGVRQAGNDAEKIFLMDKKNQLLYGMRVLPQWREKCPQKDDTVEVLEKMIAADVIVMATPVYLHILECCSSIRKGIWNTRLFKFEDLQ
jgi:multimeric flavodoxin WrbA